MHGGRQQWLRSSGKNCSAPVALVVLRARFGYLPVGFSKPMTRGPRVVTAQAAVAK
jgi:hypothetical protein